LVVPVGLFRVLPYRLGLCGKNKNDSDKVQRDHVLKEGMISKFMGNLLKKEHRIIGAKGRLPFGGSCMFAARKQA
jgi:hypothetical protein